MLQGTEIKSIRNGKVQLRDAFIRIRNNEAWISNMHISPYEQGNRFNHDPLRSRKLLFHKKQISELIGETKATWICDCSDEDVFERRLCKSVNWCW